MKRWLIVVICLLIAITIVLAKEDHAPVMVTVSGGTFQMGDEYGDLPDNTRPVHTVELTYDFEIGKLELTNGEFLKFLNEAGVSKEGQLNGREVINVEGDYCADCEFEYTDGSFSLKEVKRSNYPVIFVTWWGTLEYCNWLSEKEELTKAYNSDGSLLDRNGNVTEDITEVAGYRLPTEAEWEYAARGGNKSSGDYKYPGSETIDKVAWYIDNSNDKIQPVGKKASNELGLNDMAGNVWEWCLDAYAFRYYHKENPTINPVNLFFVGGSVLRGGSAFDDAVYCRLAGRFVRRTDSSDNNLGFRIARTSD